MQDVVLAAASQILLFPWAGTATGVSVISVRIMSVVVGIQGTNSVRVGIHRCRKVALLRFNHRWRRPSVVCVSRWQTERGETGPGKGCHLTLSILRRVDVSKVGERWGRRTVSETRPPTTRHWLVALVIVGAIVARPTPLMSEGCHGGQASSVASLQ